MCATGTSFDDYIDPTHQLPTKQGLVYHDSRLKRKGFTLRNQAYPRGCLHRWFERKEYELSLEGIAKLMISASPYCQETLAVNQKTRNNTASAARNTV
jgi:hypothetical protein